MTPHCRRQPHRKTIITRVPAAALLSYNQVVWQSALHDASICLARCSTPAFSTHSTTPPQAALAAPRTITTTGPRRAPNHPHALPGPTCALSCQSPISPAPRSSSRLNSVRPVPKEGRARRSIARSVAGDACSTPTLPASWFLRFGFDQPRTGVTVYVLYPGPRHRQVSTSAQAQLGRDLAAARPCRHLFAPQGV